MKKNKEYKQIYLHEFSGHKKNYNALSGKVVDKIAFSDRGNTDENIFIITFTDKTFIAVGTHYKDLDNGNDSPQLENFYVMDPNCFNRGDFRCHIHGYNNGELIFDEWINILRDLGLWKMDQDEVLEIIKNNKQDEEQREYEQYLRLKKKFEGELADEYK